MRQREAHDRVARLPAARGRRTRSPARPRAAARSRARRRTAPSRGRSRAARSRRRARSRRSSACPDSPRRTCSSARCPGTRAPPRARSSPTRSSPASAAGARARGRSPRRPRGRRRRAGARSSRAAGRSCEAFSGEGFACRAATLHRGSSTLAIASGATKPVAARSTRRSPRSRAGRPRSTACPAARRRRARGPRRRGSAPARRRAGARPRRRRGWRSSAAPATRTPRSAGTSGTRRPSVAGSAPHASGKRPSRVRQQQRDARRAAALQRRARARAELRQRGERRREREEHDRGGLVRRPALERVQPLDRGRRAGVAREPVDRVGGEHDDPARRDRALERVDVQSRPPLECHVRPRRRPTSTRSIPARSAIVSTSGKPASRISAGDRGRLAGADLQRDGVRRRRARRGQQAADHVEPARPGAQRERRLVADDVGRQLGAVLHVGRVRDDRVEPARSRPRAGRRGGTRPRARAAPRSPAPPPARRRSRPWRRPRGRAARTRARARSPPSRCRRRRRASPARRSSTASTRCSVSGRGISTRGSTASSIERKPFDPRM